MTGSFTTVDQEQVSAGRKTLEMVKRCIHSQQSFLVESTISGSTYHKIASLAKENGLRTTFIYVALSSAELSAQRVAKRVSLGGHTIPRDDVMRRYPRSLSNLKTYIKAFESAHIYDNSVRYQWICDYRNGFLHKASRQMPDWIKHYLP